MGDIKLASANGREKCRYLGLEIHLLFQQGA